MHIWRTITVRLLLVLTILSLTGVAHAQGRAEAAEQAGRRLTEIFQKEASTARRIEIQRADAASAAKRADEYRNSFNSAATQTSGGRWGNPANDNAMLAAQRAEADRVARAATAEANARALREQQAAAAEQARAAQLAEARRATEAQNAAIKRQQEAIAAQKRADDAALARNQQMETDRIARENAQRAQQVADRLATQRRVQQSIDTRKLADAQKARGRVFEFKGAEAASNTTNGLRLQKQLGNAEQLGQLTSGRGRVIAGAGSETPIRDVQRLAKQYGGTSSDWAKVRSNSRVASDGTRFEIHAYQNGNGQIFETKTIVDRATGRRKQ